MLFIDDRPPTCSCPAPVDLEVTQTEPGPARRHRLRRRQQAGHARDRRHRPGAAVRRTSATRVRVDTRSRRVRRRAPDGVDAPHRPAPGAVFALYQHDVTGRALEDALERDAAPFTRALAHAVQDHPEELDAAIERHAQGWTLDRIAPLERAILRVALLEMLHPDAVAGRRADPARGRDRRGGRDRQDLLRRRRARASSTASSAPRCARCARMPRPMTELDSTTSTSSPSG